jgi:predicted nucleic acid-binding protein
VIVIDASVLVVALADDGADGDRVRRRLRGEDLAAPDLIDLEVLSTLRSLVSSRKMPERRAGLALGDLEGVPITRAPHTLLLRRCWALRANLTPYDAAYVALAEAIPCVLLTADLRLARAPGVRCEVEVLGG